MAARPWALNGRVPRKGPSAVDSLALYLRPSQHGSAITTLLLDSPQAAHAFVSFQKASSEHDSACNRSSFLIFSLDNVKNVCLPVRKREFLGKNRWL
jgi:hypothetical protein